jgi:putative oxidoreductase
MLDVNVDMGILILRIAVGVVMIAHGIPKIFWKRKIYDKKWKNDYGLPVGSVIFTGFLQVLCGLAVVVGFYTQIAALILTLNMLVATYTSIWKHGEGFLTTPEGKGWDINFLLIGTFLALIFLGDGAHSLVAWLS